MSLPIPREPRGSHPLAQCLRQIIKCLTMLEPRGGLNTRVSVTTRGTMVSSQAQSKRQSTGSAARWA